jgi:CRISPR-associated endonuclease/helicase Cas3
MRIAHVKRLPDNSWAEPHWLDQHLNGTADLAAAFGKKFDSEQWGKLLGLGHDTGKSTEKWQKYLSLVSGYDEDAHLEGKSGKLDHSAPGAKLVEEIFGKGIGRVLSYCIAGHHAGLPDWYPDEAGAHSSLSNRLAAADTNEIPASIKEILNIEKKPILPYQFSRDSIDLALWIRLLFSTIVDADFLDTEKYMNMNNAGLRGGYCAMEVLLARFNSYMEDKTKNAPRTDVNTTRQAVLADCREAASKKPGIFTLNVPTGGGKTLSSLAFALEHAVKYNFERVIYVIPYTSIIEQNADVFREVLGDNQVVEHHSSIGENENNVKSRLATENWDAPVIVTTSVQFFESLFASKTSRCRKLHNIVRSVVVLDEAQLVPVDYLSPIIEVMRFLSERYHVTFVISTATQPAFEARDDFHGFAKGTVHEIVKDVPTLFQSLERIEVRYPSDFQKPDNWSVIAADVKKHNRVLCVVSDRKSCRELHKLMPAGTYHLSALMCGQHRSNAIAEIKKQLKQDVPVRVISTQLVEAGVDLDFPVVYRAMAGLDSIAQAAGRCNREGLLQGKGEVVIFVPPKNTPPGILRKASETTEILLKTGVQNPLHYSNFTTFFSELYWKANSLDKYEIIKKLTPDATDCAIQFRTAAMKFKIIDDTMQRSIIVPYRGGVSYIEELKKIGPERHLMRKLQRYTVNVYTRDFALMLNRGSIEEILPDIFVLVTNEYDEQIGLWVDDIPDNPDLFIM